MVERISQETSPLKFESPLGADVLIPVKFTGLERISENFEWKINCLLNADEDPVDPQKVIGETCTLTIEQAEEAKFSGLCTDVRFIGFRRNYGLYELILRPWLWLLTREVSSQIFHDKSVQDIIQQIFDDRGMSDFKFTLEKTYEPIPYCVQYQETPYNFVSRLMEKYGLFFTFECSDGSHEMVIRDSVNEFEDAPGHSTIDFQSDTGTGIRESRIFNWQHTYRLQTGAVDVDDYNYEKPATKLEKHGAAKDDFSHPHKDFAKYVYPSGHLEPGDGEKLANCLIDSLRAEAERMHAYGNVAAVRAGTAFTLDKHTDDAANVKYATIAVKHEAFLVHFISSSGKERILGPEMKMVDKVEHPFDESSSTVQHYYVGEYEVAKISAPYKAPMKSPWPRIHGAQTAEVIKSKNAPADEEIDVDDKGRILVRFHWNESDAESDVCSCRLRVAQIWAGSKWGGVWIPRIGQEVVVEFLNGDPDTPLVTGAVYNGQNESPIEFPAKKTQSTIKSESSKGGQGFNELRFEDKKDDEEIYIHAERDRLMEIEHDDDIEIGANQTVKIGGSREFELTGGDETIVLKGAPGTKDKYGKSITKNGNRTTTLEKGNETLTIKKGNQTTKIDMGNQTTTIKLGDQTTKINAGKGTTQATKSIELKVGGSSIKLTPASIEIKSTLVKINANAVLDAKGGAMAKIQGGIVKIN